ncbi:MAG TPA: nucleotidyltransferase domain-containing protein [Nocardioidaceae bacterium]|nr:nucleotidyltransferase domain-containing protein [Nocardioidaceae bacterium]
MDVAEAMAPLESGYELLLAKVRAVVEPDPEVRALWLAGSLGRGAADAGSDLDLIVTVTAPDRFADPDIWRSLDPVITTPLPGMVGCFAFTTRSGLRVDVVVEGVDDLPRTGARQRIAVFNRDGLTVPPPSPGVGPDLDRMQAIVTEYMRQGALFPAAVVAREDWLLGQVAVHNYGLMLYELFVESNRPLPETGVKRWSDKLSPQQREVLASLSPPRAARDEVLAAMKEVRAATSTHGRTALESAGGTWPTELDETVHGYWVRHHLA